MHYLVCILLLTTGAMARYRKYDFNKIIAREEPEESDVVECPVCGDTYGGDDDDCTMLSNGKSYKKCRHGIYVNKCGKKDCSKGPNETCFDDSDMCTEGYTCVKNKCVGHGKSQDPNEAYLLNPTAWSDRDDRDDIRRKISDFQLFWDLLLKRVSQTQNRG